MDDSVSDVSSLDISRKTAPSSRTAPGAEPEDMCPQGALLNSRTTGQLRKKIVRTREPTEKSTKGHKTNHSSCTSVTDVSTVPVITNLTIAPRDNNTRPTPLAIPPVAQVFIKTSTNSLTLHVSHHKVNPLLASPHLHSQLLTPRFSIISNIHHPLTHNLPGTAPTFSTVYTTTSKSIMNTTSAIQPTNSATLLFTIPTF